MTAISIVTPSLNQGQFLEEALESVRMQGSMGVEHLVLDGGSEDGTLKILRARGGRPEWSHLSWQSAPDDGQSDALNRGFAQAKGEIIGWLNADDRYRPGALEHVLRAFAANPELDVIYGDVADIDERGDLLRVRREIGFSRFIMLYHHVFYIPTSSAAFFRRRVFEEGNRLRTDLHYAMDYEFFLQLAKRGYRIGHVRAVVGEFRVHTGSKSCRMGREQADEKRRILCSVSRVARIHPAVMREAVLLALMGTAGAMHRGWRWAQGLVSGLRLTEGEV